MEKEKKPFNLDVVSIRMVKDAPILSSNPIENPLDAVKLLGEYLCEMDREVMCVINLKTDGTPINCTFASVGSINGTMAHPRELFKASILSNASSMILLHNHPSGDLTPSKFDTMLTDRMVNLCNMMEIPLLDHIIVGGDNSKYFSLKEQDMMPVDKITLETDYRNINFNSTVVKERGSGYMDKTQLIEKLENRRNFCYRLSNGYADVGTSELSMLWSNRANEVQMAVEILQTQDNPEKSFEERLIYCKDLAENNKNAGVDSMAQLWMARHNEMEKIIGWMNDKEEKQRLFVDMDGTLTVFTPQASMDALYVKGYFENLPPHENVVEAVRHIIDNHPEIEVNILSAYLADSEYALAEKNAWVDKNLPEIDTEHRVFIPNGSDKKEWIWNLQENDYLIDDYTKNLMQWMPARGIKLLNAINHSNGTWQYDRIRYDREPVDLSNAVVSVMRGNEHIFDKSEKEAVEQDIVKFQSAVISNYEGYVVLTQFDRDAPKTDKQPVFLGKRENYDNNGNYDNSDNSLVFISDNGKMFGFLHGDGWVVSQQEMIDNGAFTEADYAEYAKLKETILQQFKEIRQLRFEIDISDSKSGVPFRYPDWEQEKDALNQKENEKKIKIPAITVEPSVLFFEEERPAEYALFHEQMRANEEAWRNIVENKMFTGAQFTAVGEHGQTLILTKSIREGVDYQLSFFDKDGEPAMHEDYYIDNSKEPVDIVDNMRMSLYSRLAHYSYYGREITVTAEFEGKEIAMDKTDNAKIRVAIESTDDYADTKFHKELVEDDVQNEDGSYGKIVDSYRIVSVNENGKLDAFDERIFSSFDEARTAVLAQKDLELVSYDDLVYEAGNQISLQNRSQETVDNHHREDGTLRANSENIHVEGHTGTWHVVEVDRSFIREVMETNFVADYYLLEHDTYGEDAAMLIVNKNGEVVVENVYNGFDDLQEQMESFVDTLEVLEQAGYTVEKITDTLGCEIKDMNGNVHSFKNYEELTKSERSLVEGIYNRVIQAMEVAGYHLDILESTSKNPIYNYEMQSIPLSFESLKENIEWLDGVVFDDPEISDKVEKIMHPEREAQADARSKIICLDVETTGLDFNSDEILQLSIINGNGEVLFNEYIKPKEKTEWDNAEQIHGISPEMVVDKPTIDEHIPRLNEIMKEAELIVGYNSDYFDLTFIRNAGIDVPENTETYDVMLKFAPIYGEWNEKKGDYKWQKLAVCADYYGYKNEGAFHDSLEDVRATLHCYFAMTEHERLKENEVQKEATISFYVAECMEFPSLGEYHEGLTLQEAFDILEKIPSERLNGGKGIGFTLEDGSIYSGNFDLLHGNEVQDEIINMIDHYRHSPLVQQAINDCKEELEKRYEKEVLEEKKTYIANYYVIEDLKKRGALDITVHEDLESALKDYFALPSDKMKALGIQNNERLTGTIDFIQCQNGVDTIINDYQKLSGWNNPEIIAVVERITQAVTDKENLIEAYRLRGYEQIDTQDGKISFRRIDDAQNHGDTQGWTFQYDDWDKVREALIRVPLWENAELTEQVDALINLTEEERVLRDRDMQEQEVSHGEGEMNLTTEFPYLSKSPDYEIILESFDEISLKRIEESIRLYEETDKIVYEETGELYHKDGEEFFEAAIAWYGGMTSTKSFISDYGDRRENYKFFYSPDQADEAKKFQKETGWKQFWGSDAQNLNGDTIVVYRDVADLPEHLQEYAKEQERISLNAQADKIYREIITDVVDGSIYAMKEAREASEMAQWYAPSYDGVLTDAEAERMWEHERDRGHTWDVGENEVRYDKDGMFLREYEANKEVFLAIQFGLEKGISEKDIIEILGKVYEGDIYSNPETAKELFEQAVDGVIKRDVHEYESYLELYGVELDLPHEYSSTVVVESYNLYMYQGEFYLETSYTNGFSDVSWLDAENRKLFQVTQNFELNDAKISTAIKEFGDNKNRENLIDVTEEHGEKGNEKSTKYQVYMTSGLTKKEMFVADTEQEAENFCKKNSWKWIDENNFEWNLGYEEIEQEMLKAVVIDGYSCTVVDEWQDGTSSFILGENVGDDGTFYYAQVTENDNNLKGVYTYEHDERPSRESVENEHLNNISQITLDRYEAEFGADGKKAFPHLNDEPPMEYKYYSIHRPIGIGTYPREGMKSFENYDERIFVDAIDREAWGELIYSRPLSEKEIAEYEFIQERSENMEQEIVYSENEAIIKLAERIDNFMFDNDTYNYKDNIGDSLEERSEHRAKIAEMIEKGEINEITKTIHDIRDNYKDGNETEYDLSEIREANDIVYSLAYLDLYQQYYNRDTEPNAKFPIREYFNIEDGRMIEGNQIPMVMSQTPHFSDRSIVFYAVDEFEKANDIPEKQRVIFEGSYEDKEFLYDGYDRYIGMSHRNDLSVQPYMEKIKDMASKMDNPEYSYSSFLPLIAEVYYAQQNGMLPHNIDYILDNCNNDIWKLRNLRHGFEFGLEREQIEVIIDENDSMQEYLIGYMANGGSIKDAMVLKGGDIASYYIISPHLRDGSISREAAQAVIQTVNHLKEVNREDYAKQLGENPDTAEYRFNTFDYEFFIEYLTEAVVNDKTITAEQIAAIGESFAEQKETKNLRDFIESHGGFHGGYTHGEDTVKEENSRTVMTNMGEIPIEDYREIVANQNGFDSYEEMYNAGYRIGNGYDKKPERSEEVVQNEEKTVTEETKETQQTEEKNRDENAGVSIPSDKKDAKELLNEQLQQGVRNVLNSESYKNWLDTSSKLFLNNYSFNNAMLVWLQKENATHTMGYEQWKDYGRAVSKGAKGIKIFVPVIAYEKKTGDLWRMIKSNLQKQLKDDPSLEQASYRLGMTKLEITMNKGGLYGLKLDGQEQGIRSEKDMQSFIKNSVLGKVPMYFTVGTVFDVKDTFVPEKLWVKKGFTKDEMVRDENGKAIKNKKGEYQIVNTPERQAKFTPHLDTSIPEKDPAKMAILYQSLKAVSERNGIHVYEKDREDDKTLKDGADGYFSRDFSAENPKGYIVMPKDLEPTKAVSVMLHEMSHSELHGNLTKLAEKMGEENIPRHMREIQAESVAYIVGKNFGIETDMSSFKYLASYSQGFELQALSKSIEVIYNECKQLTNELKAELESRGLNMDLSEKENAVMSKESVESISKAYATYAVEQDDRLMDIEKELPSLAEQNADRPQLLAVVVGQAGNVERQKEDVALIKDSISSLESADTFDKQKEQIAIIESAKARIEGYKKDFSDLSVQFQELAQEKQGLKDRFVADPIATIKSMKQDYPKLAELSDAQVQYLTKSDYVSKELTPLLRNAPDQFVEKAFERASQIDKIASKNGMFVEVNFCEQWTEQPIVQDGAMMHPKVADTIVKQAEKQLGALRVKAESMGDYFPYSKCKLTVFQAEKGVISNAYATRVDIGDGMQKSLVDHLKQECRSKDFVADFEKSTNEKGAKEKILFNTRSEEQPQKEEKVKDAPLSERAMNREEWSKEIDSAREAKNEQEGSERQRDKIKDKSDKEKA